MRFSDQPSLCGEPVDQAAGERHGAEREPEQPSSDLTVTVHAPGRLHLGFLDPSASLGRRFGSFGMMLEDAATVISLASADVQHFEAPPLARHELDRARRIIARLQAATGCEAPLQVQIRSALPAHVGLGSGTQLALAIGRAFSELHGLGLATSTLAQLLDRGRRSGIGIAGFDQGGVLVDGGPHPGSEAPPLLARFDFPQAWRVILVQEPARSGLHGEGEKSGMARLARFEQPQSAHLCHLVLMMILPALAESDFAPFAKGLSELQRLLGEYFAPVQGGVYTSPAIGRLMRWIGEHEMAAIGQSSWGPTAFAILPSEIQAEQILAAAAAAGMIDGGIEAKVVAGRNRGAVVTRNWPD
jgi:beta-ribofuranosylaminobenzene 5'-phosphate synthase